MSKIDRWNSIQTPFIEWMIASTVVVDIWMDSGQHLEGLIVSYDSFTVLLRSPSGKTDRLLTKCQISAIRPKEKPTGRMKRLITAPRRKGHRPLEHFEHPVDTSFDDWIND